MRPLTRLTLFLLFFLSGFSSLVYQVVWTRMAFASFGIIAPVLSIVLSVFMLGLAIGSWAGGRYVGPLTGRTRLSAAVYYAAAEMLIGVSAFAVPRLFVASARLLLPTGQVDSGAYLLWSAVALAASLLPWCVCMGATFPLMMAHVRERDPARADGFSFLYLANVLGAMAGTLLTALVLVELFGFRHTLWVAASANFAVALVALALGLTTTTAAPTTGSADLDDAPAASPPKDGRFAIAVLFTTGFLSMAMEVVWTRSFAPVLKTQVYSFAMIVFAYLGATFAGSAFYRWSLRRGWRVPLGGVFAGLAATALLPVIVQDPSISIQRVGDPAIDLPSAALLLASLCPLCGLLGYLTPRLIDEHARGNPRRAGTAYAANVVGCILGPLVACYGLLPHVGHRHALVLLALPLPLFWFVASRRTHLLRRVIAGAVVGVAFGYAAFGSLDFEEVLTIVKRRSEVRRDYIASVAAYGSSTSEKALLVNGFGMTRLVPITKFIAHLPLALHEGPPRSALVICFGMGTTFRSALTWDVDTTAVELVPSVPREFGFFFADADRVRANPRGHIVIDDGRRFLERSGRSFDVITIDPPPPVTAAGSSLLFSREFYALAKRRLNAGGVLQMWFPGTRDETSRRAIMRAMADSFPHVMRFGSVAGWGDHLVGSMQPFAAHDAATLVARMPAAARADLVEWSPGTDPTAYVRQVISRELPILDAPALADPQVVVTDDRPMNEYYLLRNRALSRD